MLILITIILTITLENYNENKNIGLLRRFRKNMYSSVDFD